MARKSMQTGIKATPGNNPNGYVVSSPDGMYLTEDGKFSRNPTMAQLFDTKEKAQIAANQKMPSPVGVLRVREVKSMQTKAFDKNHEELDIGDQVRIDSAYGGGVGQVVRVNRSGNYIIVKTPRGEESFQGVDVTLHKSLKGATKGKERNYQKAFPPGHYRDSDGDRSLSKDTVDEAYADGLKAGRNNATSSNNPYSRSKHRNQWDAWIRGYTEGNKKNLQGAKSMPDINTPDDLEPEVKAEPYGAQVARRLHEDASILMKDYDEMIGLVEHEPLKKLMRKKLEGMTAELDDLEKMFGDSYPDLKGLGIEDDEDIETKDDDALDAEGMDDLDLEGKADDAMGADSIDEDAAEPTPEEVVEGMATKGWKRLGRKSLETDDEDKKALDEEEKEGKGCDDMDKDKKDMNDDPLEVAYSADGKSWRKKDFDTEDDRQKFIKMLKTKGFDDDDIMVRGGKAAQNPYDLEIRKIGDTWRIIDPSGPRVLDNSGRAQPFKTEAEAQAALEKMQRLWDQGHKDLDALENNDMSVGKALDDEAKETIDEVKTFLKDLAEENSDLDEEKRLKSYHYHKELDDVAGDAEENEFAVEKCFAKYLKKAMPGTPEWAAEEASEPEHKGWHKNDDEVVDDDKDLTDEEKEEKRLKALRKELDTEDDVKKLCKACSKFFKSLSREKAFGRMHRAKAAFFKDMMDPLTDDMEKGIGCDCGDSGCPECGSKELPPAGFEEVPADVLGDKDIDPDSPFEPGEMGEKRLSRLERTFAKNAASLNALAKKLHSTVR